MLRFSKKSEYGLMAVHYIAFHQQDGVVNSKRIAEDLGIPAELLAKILQRLSKGKLIASVNVFDVYEGKGIDPGKKSLAIAVTIQPREKTMTDAEIDALGAKIVAEVSKRTGGVLRG